MYIDNHTIHFAATDVSSHVNCPYLTQLKLKVAKGELQKPVYDSISLETLREKGQEFENEYLAELKAQGFNVVEIDREDKHAEALTQKAMQDGADYIYQARLKQGIYYGCPHRLVNGVMKSLTPNSRVKQKPVPCSKFVFTPRSFNRFKVYCPSICISRLRTNWSHIG
jgi:hypothetical protein